MGLNQAGIAQKFSVPEPGGGKQDRLLATVEILRRICFKGYIHLKIIPGAERDQVLQKLATGYPLIWKRLTACGWNNWHIVKSF
jgi:hypothetical protein